MAKLKVWTRGEKILVSGACTARACGGEFRREIELEKLLETLKRDELGAAKWHLAKQAFRAMVKKLHLDREPEPTDIPVPLVCEDCLEEINESRTDHREEPGV